MEFLNKVELVGVVGNVKIREINGGLGAVASIGVATNSAYKNNDGTLVVATEWHNVTAFEGKNITDVNAFAKGDRVRVVGKLKNRKYTGTDGVERYVTEVVASSMEKLDVDNLSLPM